MNKVIVFGVNLQNTLGLIRSMGEVGYPVYLLLEPCDKSYLYVNHSKYIVKTHFLSSTEDALEILKDNYWDEKEKPVIYCGSDTSIRFLDANYNILSKNFILWNALNEQGRINYYLDKINTFPIAERVGFSVIKTWLINDRDHIPNDIIYPCLTKGNNSTESTKNDIHICYNREELISCLRNDVEYLVQEYIEKEYELNVVGFSYNHGKNVYTPAVVRKIRDKVGRQSVYIKLEDIKNYSNLNPLMIQQFVESIGYEGIFSIELLFKNNRYYFLEINMRNDACGYLYTSAGINYPKLWYDYSTGVYNLNTDIKFKSPYYLMQEDDVYNLIEGKVSFLTFIKDLKRTNAFFKLNLNDPMPFIISTLIHIRQACKKILVFIRK